MINSKNRFLLFLQINFNSRNNGLICGRSVGNDELDHGIYNQSAEHMEG